MFPNKKYYEFPLPTLGSPDWDAISPTLDELFEELYGEGIRYFIVTMSDTVLKLTADHPMRGESVWEKFSKRHEIDPPILIATVASAPLPAGAVVSNGVIRNYIRSLDEVNQFVAYMASRNKADPEVFLLYINDDYGTEARDLIKRKLEQDQQAIKKMIPIELSGNDFDAIFRELDDEIDDAENRYTFVILVGYGDMVVGMLDVLNREEQSYQTSGISRVEEVLAASTLTEKAWQPTFYRDTRGQFLPRISTVKPFGENADCEGSVVCQFSHMTLSIVLECDDTRGIEEFFSCFERQTRTSGFPDIELSTKGDSIVPLRIAVTEGIGVSVSEPSD